MNKKIKIYLLLFIIIAIISTNFYFLNMETGINSKDTTKGIIHLVNSKLYLSDKPLLNAPVTLTLKLNESLLNFSNLSAEIRLPDNFELISGNLKWQGDLNKNETQKIEVVIKSTKVGYSRLESTIFGESNLKEYSRIYTEVSQEDAIIGSRPKNNWYEPAQSQITSASTNNEQISSELIISQKPKLNEKLTIIYRLTPSIDIPDSQRTQMSLMLPPKAFEVIEVQFPKGGETYRLSWKGSIKQGQTVEIKVTVKVINEGWGIIFGILNVQPSGTITKVIVDQKSSKLYVDKYGGTMPPNYLLPLGT